MKFLQGALLLIFLGATLIFAVQNMAPVEVHFLNWVIRAPISLVVIVIYLLGMLSGWTVLSFVRRSIRRVSERPQAE